VWMTLTANVLWLLFAVVIHDERVVALQVVQTALTSATALRYGLSTGWQHNARPAAFAGASIAGFGCLAAAGTAFALEALGVAIGVVIGAPQLVYLWRRRAGTIDVAGVSQPEYMIVIAAQAAWTLYWVLRGHPFAAVGAAWGGMARTVTLALLRAQRARQPASAASTAIRA
jgi:hypothetical protein